MRVSCMHQSAGQWYTSGVLVSGTHQSASQWFTSECWSVVHIRSASQWDTSECLVVRIRVLAGGMRRIVSQWYASVLVSGTHQSASQWDT